MPRLVITSPPGEHWPGIGERVLAGQMVAVVALAAAEDPTRRSAAGRLAGWCNDNGLLNKRLKEAAETVYRTSPISPQSLIVPS